MRCPKCSAPGAVALFTSVECSVCDYPRQRIKVFLATHGEVGSLVSHVGTGHWDTDDTVITHLVGNPHYFGRLLGVELWETDKLLGWDPHWYEIVDRAFFGLPA